jgi:hypothetical protein
MGQQRTSSEGAPRERDISLLRERELAASNVLVDDDGAILARDVS